MSVVLERVNQRVRANCHIGRVVNVANSHRAYVSEAGYGVYDCQLVIDSFEPCLQSDITNMGSGLGFSSSAFMAEALFLPHACEMKVGMVNKSERKRGEK